AASIRRLGHRRMLISTGVSRFPLNGCAGHKELTFIAQIFLCNALRNLLCAFEASGRIKVAAILTAVEVGFALGTLAFVLNVDRGRNDRAAQSASEYFLKPRHFHRPRGFSGLRTARAAFWLFSRFFTFSFATVAVTILVTTLAVFSFHRKDLEANPRCSNHLTVVLT